MQANEAKRLHELNDVARAAATANVTANTALQNEKAKANHFESVQAAHWERQVQELPVLKAEAKALHEQISVAEAQHQDATLEYERLKSKAKDEAAALLLDREQEKQVPQRCRSQTLTQIDKAERDAIAAYDDEYRTRHQQLEEDMQELQEERGNWEGKKLNPAASHVAIQALAEADQKRQDHFDSVEAVQRTASRATNELQAAKHAFALKEADLRVARDVLARANEALSVAQSRHSPNTGTLLATLRTQVSEDWKRNLAKVIDPALLDRQDLDPMLLEDVSNTAFGWQLNTGVIETPDWTDDSLTRQALAQAEAGVDAARHLISERETELARCSADLKKAELTAQTTEARLTLLNGQTDDIKQQRVLALAAVEKERREAVQHVESELSRVNRLIADTKTQRQRLATEKQQTLKSIKAEHDKMRAEAEATYSAAIDAINAQIARVQQSLAERLSAYNAQLDEHLSKAGVDTKRLAELRDQSNKLRTAIAERDDRMPMVGSWRQWLDSGGPTQLQALKTAAEKTARDCTEAAGDVSRFEQSMNESKIAYEKRVHGESSRLIEVEGDLDILRGLEEVFGDYQAAGTSVIDRMTPATTLRKQVHDARSALTRLENELQRRTSTLRNALTTKPSAVQEFVRASLDQDPTDDTIRQAASLSSCYKQIGAQVAANVNLTLQTLLLSIGTFHKSIKGFEREVAHFNNRLQKGLTEVRCFERLKDLRLDIVTNFEGLGFYKKLAAMEDVMRRHASEVGQDYTTTLPPDETARALGDFMSVLGNDGNVEVNLASHITIKGSVLDNGQHKEFKRASELENISSEGLTSLVLITLMTALLNTIRGTAPVHVPWVTDEVGKFDPSNFRALMQKLTDNRIDVLTASPELGPTQQSMFARRYLFKDKGVILEYQATEEAVNEVSA